MWTVKTNRKIQAQPAQVATKQTPSLLSSLHDRLLARISTERKAQAYGKRSMLFMTSRDGGPIIKSMQAHQELFGRFLSIRNASHSVGLWENWGMDNGAFTGFDQDLFMRKLKPLLSYKSACRFVVVPDVPFQWEPTLIKFKDWSPSLRRMGFPIGLAVQDGATVENIPWSEIDALFIGGSTEWKRQTGIGDLPLFKATMGSPVPSIINEAKARRKWVHIGRSANSPKQLWYAYNLGAHSIDGSGERYEPTVKYQWISQTMWEIYKTSNC